MIKFIKLKDDEAVDKDDWMFVGDLRGSKLEQFGTIYFIPDIAGNYLHSIYHQVTQETKYLTSILKI